MTDQTPMDRNEIEALLVFLANDTLEGDERRRVEEAVAADPGLHAELEALKALRTEMQAEEAPRSPGEFGLARLMRDIKAEEAAPASATAQTGTVSSLWRIAAIGALALFLGQAILTGTSDDPDVTLAGGEEETQLTEHTIRVAFAPAATEADIRDLLISLDLVIIDGPSALGLYTLAASSDEARTSALAALGEAADIVESAE